MYIGQGEESLQQIISILREESLPQIVLGIYEPHAILQNLSENRNMLRQSRFDYPRKESVDLDDQRDIKGRMSFISFRELEGFPKDQLPLARNVLNQLPAKVSSKFSCSTQ